MPFTNEQKIACLDREIAMRHRVYPRFVAQSRMNQAEADREIALMTAIRADLSSANPLRLEAEPVTIEPRLFGEPGERA